MTKTIENGVKDESYIGCVVLIVVTVSVILWCVWVDYLVNLLDKPTMWEHMTCSSVNTEVEGDVVWYTDQMVLISNWTQLWYARINDCQKVQSPPERIEIDTGVHENNKERLDSLLDY